MTTFKAGETYRTRDGREARVYATDCGREDCQLHGAILKAPGIWMARTWRADGSWIDAGNPQDDDLMTTTPHPAPAEKLTAEEEALRKFLAAAKKTSRWNLMADDHSLVAFYSHTKEERTGVSPNDLARALDASRAETEAVRRQCILYMGQKGFKRMRENEAIRSLAAELVEGLEGVREHMDGHLDSDCRECAEWKGGLDGVLSRARAQGIGGEKEKGNA